MKKVYFRKAGLLVAGPTTGKTTLLSNLKQKGVTDVIDSDSIIEDVLPEYFRDRWWAKSHSPEGRLVHKCRDLVASDEIIRAMTDSTVVLSNLWSEDFLSNLLGSGVKPSLFVFRSNFVRISNLASTRSQKLSEGLTSKWVASAESYGLRVFENVIWLPDDLFLSDVVTLKGASWTLTDIGKSLLNKPLADVIRLGLWNRGPVSKDAVKQGGSNG